MENISKLIVTSNYYENFKELANVINNKSNEIENKTLIFCDEKCSMMAEKVVVDTLGSTFNTEVYSFGNYLKSKKQFDNVLSVEGSIMALKKIINNCQLECFSKSRVALSNTMHNLIIQLKSAKVSCSEIKDVADKTDGLLKDKLVDISVIYENYEKFLDDNNLEDQSSILSFLPKLIEDDENIKNVDVILLGYVSWTKQGRNVIASLLKNAKSVTAILTEGENTNAYVNETAEYFKKICKEEKVNVETIKAQTNLVKENKLILENLFSPTAFNKQQMETNKIYKMPCNNVLEEVEKIATLIKSSVVNSNARYKDFSIALNDAGEYNSIIEQVFYDYEIPYYIDKKRKALNHPLCSLLLSYIDFFRRNKDRKCLLSIVKNPLVSINPNVADAFENYIVSENLYYKNFENTFENVLEEYVEEFENIRKLVLSFTKNFDIKNMFDVLNVKEKLQDFSIKLNDIDADIEEGVNKQVYDYIISILEQIKLLLRGENLSYTDYRSMFLSGLSSLEISIIPQYQDAVYIGTYRDIAILNKENVITMGLNDNTPAFSDDTSILSDIDISTLSNLQVLIEPEIRVVNQRLKEAFTLCLASFKNKLFLSYTTNNNGKEQRRSEAFLYLDFLFNIKDCSIIDDIFTKRQGLKKFAKDCGLFSLGKNIDFDFATAYYFATKDNNLSESVLNSANAEIKEKLEDRKALIDSNISVTHIENFYACPYKAFMENILRASKKDSGEVNFLNVGNFLHNVFEEYIKRVNEVDSEDKSNKVAEEIISNILLDKGYSKFLNDIENKNSINNLIREGKKYCYKLYMQLYNSDFKPIGEEIAFGYNDKNYPALDMGYNVKLKGKIDRIDTNGDYFRIIDYKTGSVDELEKVDKNLFIGKKIQLFLYSNAIKNKRLVGAYYLAVDDSFVSDGKEKKLVIGKTINEKDIALSLDKTISTKNGTYSNVKLDNNNIKDGIDEKTFIAYQKYAYEIAKNATKEIMEDVIVASPLDDTCDYCPYASICKFDGESSRTVKSINKDTIVNAVKGDE